MFSNSFQSADIVPVSDGFSLIDFTDTTVPAPTLPDADEPVENLNFDDYLVFPPQDDADKLRQSSPTQIANLASVEPTLDGNTVDVSQLTNYPGLDLHAWNFASSSSRSDENVNTLPSFDASTKLPTLAHSTQPTLAEVHIDHCMVSSGEDTFLILFS